MNRIQYLLSPRLTHLLQETRPIRGLPELLSDHELGPSVFLPLGLVGKALLQVHPESPESLGVVEQGLQHARVVGTSLIHALLVLVLRAVGILQHLADSLEPLGTVMMVSLVVAVLETVLSLGGFYETGDLKV